jgi:hypothetical protein
VATGIQDKFSWKDVGMAFISGGLGAGASAPGNWIQQATRAVVRSAVSQAVGVTLGLQDKFSWAAVAAAGVGSAAGSLVGGIAGRASTAVNEALGGGKLAVKLGTVVNGTVVGMADAIGNAAARSLIEGTDFGDNIRAAIPSVLGNAIASGIFSGKDGTGSSASENEGPNLLDRFADGLLAGAGSAVRGIGSAVSSAATRAGDWLGFDGKFGTQGASFGDLSVRNLGKAFRAISPTKQIPTELKSEAEWAAEDGSWIDQVSRRIDETLLPAQYTAGGIYGPFLSGVVTREEREGPDWPFGEFEQTGKLSDIAKRPFGFLSAATEEMWNAMLYEGFGGGAVVSGATGAIGATQNWSKLEAEAARVWARSGIGPAMRGRLLEATELIGYQSGVRLASNQPVIDHFANGVATSIKSINLASPSFQSGNRLSQLLTRQVNNIAAYRGSTFGGARISENAITARQLVVIVPRGATATQTLALNQAQVYARTKGVTMVVRRYP